jgi:hypothetical protein
LQTRKKDPTFKRKSMPSTHNKKSGFAIFSLYLLVCLTLSACAGKPWTTPLEGDRYNETGQLIDSLTREYEKCGAGLEGDLALFYSDPLEKTSVGGYLRYSLPGSYKFVVTNPFGQTLLAIAGDQKAYQLISVPEKKYMAGSMRSFSLRHGLPEEILNGRWGEWLTGRSLRPSTSITAVHEDREGRGLWISFRNENSEPPGISHLLLEPVEKIPIARILENGAGKIIAEVTYGDWIAQGECRQPQEINISGLDYGTDIRLKLSNVRLTSAAESYTLPVPPGYVQQIMP